MELSVSHQLFVFVCMFLCGGATGIIFDIFRALRRCIKSGSGIILAQDLMLWFVELVIVYYTAFKVNNAELRGYEAIALILGAFIYFITLSEHIVRLVCKIIAFLLKIFGFVARPFKGACIMLAKAIKKLFLYTKEILMLLKAVLYEKKHKN